MEVLFLKMWRWDWNMRCKRPGFISTHTHTYTRLYRQSQSDIKPLTSPITGRVWAVPHESFHHVTLGDTAAHPRNFPFTCTPLTTGGRGGRYLLIAAAYASLHTSYDRCVCVCWVELKRFCLIWNSFLFSYECAGKHCLKCIVCACVVCVSHIRTYWFVVCNNK